MLGVHDDGMVWKVIKYLSFIMFSSILPAKDIEL